MNMRFVGPSRVFAHLSTAEYRDSAVSILRLGTGADMDSGALLLLVAGPDTLAHAGLAHAGPGLIARCRSFIKRSDSRSW